MPKMYVKRSIAIEASIEKVYEVVRDFRQWRPWSPWLIAEPECEVTYADDGKSYSWDGRIVGSGMMEIVGETAPRSIQYRLTFLKPWKSVSDVEFTFTEKGDAVVASWSMDGSIPFFLFFLKGMMTGFIGMDYERGLNMLKDHVETGAVPSKLEFPGLRSFPGTRYVGVKTRCEITQMGPQMKADMAKLQAYLGESGSTASGAPFSIYHKFSPAKGSAEYTLAIPLAAPPATPPAGLVCGEVPACEVYPVRHTGPYRHIGNAWSAGIFHARSKVFRKNNKIHPFEIYENDSSEVAESDLVTVVNFAAK